MKFGDYLRQKREQKSWTQPEAAARADIEQSYLSKIETGKSYPSEEIFNRLVAAYEINTDELSKQVFSTELDRLKEIKEVRTAVLVRKKTEITFVRGWMIAGLVFLMIGGACIGLASIPDDAAQQLYYRSTGVLLPGDDLSAFDIVEGDYRPDVSTFPTRQEFLSRQQAMIERIDENDVVTTRFRGRSFVEDVPAGKRYYQFYGDKEIELTSTYRWLISPGLMFLAGSFGCFLISLRWK